MPGLAVIISPADRRENEAVLQGMIASMQHEPFYVSGSHVDEEARLYVAWSVHPGSYCDCMPITSEDGNRVLFFYGEHHRDGDVHESPCSETAREVGTPSASSSPWTRWRAGSWRVKASGRRRRCCTSCSPFRRIGYRRSLARKA